MKKLILVPMILIAFFLSPQQEVKAQANQAISGDAVGFLFGVLSATYEQRVSEWNSFTAMARFWKPDDKRTGFGIAGSYRWYLLPESGVPLKGFSVGPIAGIENWGYDNDSIDRLWALYLGGEIAYKFVFNKNFVVEPRIQMQFNLLDDTSNRIRVYDGSNFILGVNLGYTW